MEPNASAEHGNPKTAVRLCAECGAEITSTRKNAAGSVEFAEPCGHRVGAPVEAQPAVTAPTAGLMRRPPLRERPQPAGEPAAGRVDLPVPVLQPRRCAVIGNVQGRQHPAFLSTARGGHCSDPGARCPYCLQPAGLHQGVDLTPKGSWFPLRAIVCLESEVKPPEPTSVSMPTTGPLKAGQLVSVNARGEACCATCGGKRWIGEGYRQPCAKCNPEGET